MTAGARHAPPRAMAMLESLRGLGYSTPTALADIVDNSISAGADEVRIDFQWDGDDSRVLISDDGRGMSDPDLESAMRLGDRNPLAKRAATDLGRFGLGLKTASFSQCRRLTVASVRDGARSCLRWDLDVLAADSDWMLLEGAHPGSEQHLKGLVIGQSGTIVMWERLDRIVTDGSTVDDFLALIDSVEAHLAMVFHRLIGGSKPRLRLLMNGSAVRPWDPFMSGHPAKPWTSPVARQSSSAGDITARAHVLPHKDRLTREEFDRAAGPAGWTAQQGFYVYRNERLLVAGGWLGLGPSKGWHREEAIRLARIQLDIPNTADVDWNIDVRKSVARPPLALRPWLTRLAEDTRTRARTVFAWRGIPEPAQRDRPVAQVWQTDHLKHGVRYRINESHPAVAAVIALSEQSAPLVRAMLRVIEESVPVQRIWLDTAEQRETPRTAFHGEPPQAVISVLQTIFADMVKRRGLSEEEARNTLASTEPFQKYPDLIARLGLGTIAAIKD